MLAYNLCLFQVHFSGSVGVFLRIESRLIDKHSFRLELYNARSNYCKAELVMALCETSCIYVRMSRNMACDYVHGYVIGRASGLLTLSAILFVHSICVLNAFIKMSNIFKSCKYDQQ